MPLMFNLNENGKLGDAAAVYLPDDLYVPRRWMLRYPRAIAFVLVKTDTRRLHPFEDVEGLVGMVWDADQENVRAYLTDEERRRELEPMYQGSWVSESRHARLLRQEA